MKYSSLGDAPGAARAIGSPEWLAGTRVIKETERTSVFGGEIDGSAVIVKTMRLRAWRDLLSRLVGRTRLARQLRGAQLLEDAGIATAKPLLLVRGKRSDQSGVFEALVLEKVEGEDLLHVIARGGLTVNQEHALARAVGEQVDVLASSDLFNRDHKPSNLMVSRWNDGHPKLTIIDTVGVRTTPMSWHEGSMLANLVAEFVGTGTLPRRSLLMRAAAAVAPGMAMRDDYDWTQGKEAQDVWRAVETRFKRHGDCTPKDDPLQDS